MQSETFNNRQPLADQGATMVTTWLKSNPLTIQVRNVEKEREYQIIDVDLIHTAKRAEGISEKLLEIKADGYSHTGNLIFETESNDIRKTPGCFLYTKADFIMYVFVNVRHLYVLPMPHVRNWFLKSQSRFNPYRTATRHDNGEILYYTSGYKVPIADVLQAFPSVSLIQLPEIA